MIQIQLNDSRFKIGAKIKIVVNAKLYTCAANFLCIYNIINGPPE